MALGVVPAEVYALTQEVEELKKSRVGLEVPTVSQGYTLDKLPNASYALKGGKVNVVEAWDDYQYSQATDYGSIYNPSEYTHDPFEPELVSGVDFQYWEPGRTKLKEGYRMGDNGQVQKKRTYEEYEPYEWALEDPYGEIRSQLTDSENARVAKLTDTRNQLAEKESRLLAYNRTVRGYSGDAASRPGTRRKGVLGNRPTLG